LDAVDLDVVHENPDDDADRALYASAMAARFVRTHSVEWDSLWKAFRADAMDDDDAAMVGLPGEGVSSKGKAFAGYRSSLLVSGSAEVKNSGGFMAVAAASQAKAARPSKFILPSQAPTHLFGALPTPIDISQSKMEDKEDAKNPYEIDSGSTPPAV